MLPNKISKLICPYCKGSLGLLEYDFGTGIIRCDCALYPVVANIIYLKRDRYAKKAIVFIRKRKYISAFLILLNLRKLLLFPVLLIYKFNKIFNKIGFKKTVKFLSFFSSSKKWFWYLINRDKIPSYHISRLAYNLVKSNNPCVVDLGCGVGQALSNNAIGIDKSFVNLLLARIFFATSNNILICSDLEKGLPFKTSSLDLIISTDTFHYLRNKSLFLKEIKRCLNISGILSIVHTLNVSKKGNISGLTPVKFKKMAEDAGFRKLIVLSNETILEKMIINKNRKIRIESKDTNIKKCYAFNLFAAKTDFPKKYIKLSDLNNRPIVYKNDEELAHYLNFRKLLESFDRFVFISPHLDDAVLSCGQLLLDLKRLKKKVTVITIFTKPGLRNISPQAKKFLKNCGYLDAAKLYRGFRSEDARVLKFLNAKPAHLNFIDAAWRLKSRNIPVYRSEDAQFSGKVSLLDARLIKKVRTKLNILISKSKRLLVIGSLGIGGHVDHIIVRELLKEIETPKLFWEDFPYNTNPYFLKRFFRWNYKYKKAFNLKGSKNIKKIKAIKMYKSQINMLFGKKEIPNLPEKYYYLKDSRIPTNFFAELSDE